MKVSALLTILVLIGLLAVMSFFQKSTLEVQWTKPKLQYDSYRFDTANFQWQGQNKQDLSLAQFKGQVVLVTLWAHNCWPCLQELPLLNEVIEAIGNQDLIVLAFHVGTAAEEKEQALAFWQSEDLTFQNFFVSPDWAEKVFSTTKLPSHFLINREGQMIWKHEGPIQWTEPAVEEFLSKSLLPAQPEEIFEEGATPHESSE